MHDKQKGLQKHEYLQNITQLLWLEMTLFSKKTSPQNRKTFVTQSKHMLF